MPSTNQPPRAAPVLTYLSEIGEAGNLTIVTPGPIEDQMPMTRLEIDEARELHRAGLGLDASKLVLRIEKRLQITNEERIAAARGEPWEGDLMAALQALSPGKPEADDKPDRMPVPRDFRRYNEAEERRIDAVNQERLRAKLRGNRGSVALAEGKLADIARRRHQRVELKERHDGIAETVALAKGRGEEVEEKPASGGAAHIISRDALAHMLKLGHISRSQYAAGLAYRRAFEARGSDLQASQISDAGGKGHDNDAFVARKMDQAKAANFAKECEVAVRMATMVEHHSALQMLQWVAGTGRSMRDFGGGRAFERNRAALAMALEVVASLRAEVLEKAG